MGLLKDIIHNPLGTVENIISNPGQAIQNLQNSPGISTIEGAALTALTGDPLLAAGIVGGVTGIADKSISAGLMAGLGAYGGASIASSLEGAGASDLGNSAVADTTGGATYGLSAKDAAALAAGPIEGSTPLTSIPINNIADAQSAYAAGQISSEQYASLATQYGNAAATPTASSALSAMGTGAKDVANNIASGNFSAAAAPFGGAYGAAKSAAAVALPYMASSGSASNATSTPTATQLAPTSYIRPYNFSQHLVPVDPNNPAAGMYLSSDYTQLPAYVAPGPAPSGAASGGLMKKMAVGGISSLPINNATIPQQLSAKAVGGNTMAPMANIQTPAYAQATQTPMPQSPYGMAKGGVARFDGGGTTGSIDLHVPIGSGGGGGGGGYGGGGGGYGGGGGGYSGSGGSGNLGQLPMNAPMFAPMNAPQQMQQAMPMQAPSGLSAQAIQANPQGFQQWLQGMQQQNATNPGSTMFNQGQIQQMQQNPYVQQQNFNPYARQQQNFNPYAQQANIANEQMMPLAKGGVARFDGGGSASSSDLANMQAMYMQQILAAQEDQNPYGSMNPTPTTMAAAGGAMEGPYNLGGYSDGGRLLRGPGDGVSDDIPATIGGKQPARLADGEFVIPARIVSELGNGSTDAGAKRLYAMMDRIQKARQGTVGKGRVARNSHSERHLPA